MAILSGLPGKYDEATKKEFWISTAADCAVAGRLARSLTRRRAVQTIPEIALPTAPPTAPKTSYRVVAAATSIHCEICS